MMLPVHPIASAFPDMDADRYASLKADIAKRGVIIPIITWRGQIVDGRHRARACEELGGDCPHREVECAESELPALVWSLNAERRDLTPSQRALVAGKMMNLQLGSNQYDDKRVCTSYKPTSRKAAAKAAGVSPAYVDRALRVLRSGDTETIAAVEKGDLNLYSAVAKVRPYPNKKKADDAVAETPPTAKPDGRRDRMIPNPTHEQFALAVQKLDVGADIIAKHVGAASQDIRRKEFLATLRQVRTTISRVINALEAAA